ncbi:hypothetical protein KL910_004262 [Ogataea haglerorum]|nr:hypothetical protein KL945_003455 [Ogataea haglerorum]KAG7786415.1 hypothetical protein KL910_004262 [Ogataea haglerorum]
MNQLQDLINSVSKSSTAQTLLQNEHVRTAWHALQKNESWLLYGSLSLAVALLVSRSLAAQPKPKKRKRSKRSKLQKPEPPNMSPEQQAQQDIDAILRDFETNYVPEMDKYIEAVEQEIAKPGPSKRKGKKSAKKSDASYKQKFEYQYLYFNESLLKLLMKLDSVEIYGSQDLRTKRKQCIKMIQNYLKKLDSYKPEIDKLTVKGL